MTLKEALKNKGPGYVYVIGPPHPIHIKIGYTTQPERRLLDLRREWMMTNEWRANGAGPNTPIVLYAMFKGGIRLERCFFDRYAEHRLWDRVQDNEYFEFVPRILHDVQRFAKDYGLNPGNDYLYPVFDPDLNYYKIDSNMLGTPIIDRSHFDALRKKPLNLMIEVPAIAGHRSWYHTYNFAEACQNRLRAEPS